MEPQTPHAQREGSAAARCAAAKTPAPAEAGAAANAARAAETAEGAAAILGYILKASSFAAPTSWILALQ